MLDEHWQGCKMRHLDDEARRPRPGDQEYAVHQFTPRSTALSLMRVCAAGLVSRALDIARLEAGTQPSIDTHSYLKHLTLAGFSMYIVPWPCTQILWVHSWPYSHRQDSWLLASCNWMTYRYNRRQDSWVLGSCNWMTSIYNTS